MTALVMWCLLLAARGVAAATTTEGRRGGSKLNSERSEDGVGGTDGNAKPQPHFVLIVADDLGWNDVPWNNKAVKAPHMEALAREGVILEQSYVQPICSPTRSALLTGSYPFRIGRQHGVIRPAEPEGLNLGLTLLPEMLKELGYATHAVGKWHLGFCSWDYTPTERGFDTFYGYYTGAEDYYHHTRDWSLTGKENDTIKEHCNDLYCDNPLVPDNTTRIPYLDLRNNTTPDRSKNGIYSSHLFASRVEELLERNPEEPMFLYLPFQSVHSPLQVPDEYIKPYSYISNHGRRTKLGMVSAMDEAIGRVVTALKSSGHYNNSIIIFTTDNGGPTVSQGNNWPLRGNKSTIWEGGTRGAAFVHTPLLPNPGTSNHALIHVTDWFPTLVEMAGGVAPSGIDGVAQWDAISEQRPSQRALMVYNIDNTTNLNAGIRMGQYKLLVGNPGPGEWTPPPEGISMIPKEGQSLPEPTISPSTTSTDGEELREKMDSDANTTTTTVTTTTTTTTTSTTTTATTSTTDDDDTEDEEREGVLVVVEDEDEVKEEEEKVVASEEYVNSNLLGDEVSRLLQEMSGKNDTQVRLYDLQSDPLEKHNLAATHTQVVRVMVSLLNSYMLQYTPAEVADEVPEANPRYFSQMWSPGWC